MHDILVYNRAKSKSLGHFKSSEHEVHVGGSNSATEGYLSDHTTKYIRGLSACTCLTKDKIKQK